jgi:hypothetical protein
MAKKIVLKFSACPPWGVLANAYYLSFNASIGRPAKDSPWLSAPLLLKIGLT